MTAVDELLAFLHAQLDEDERVAREALHPDAINPGAWITEHHNSATHSEPNRCHIAEDKGGHYWSVAHEVFIPNAEHIARWDPAHVLAEVEAKRRVLELAEPGIMRALATQDPDFRDGYVAACEDAVKALAQPYAGQPGWREEWRT